MTECIICFCDNVTRWKYLNCGHKFHKKCINKWLSKNEKCPLCRRICKKTSKYKEISDEENSLGIFNVLSHFLFIFLSFTHFNI